MYRSDLACQIALDATATVATEQGGRREIDIKRYAKIEKVFNLQNDS
jgi:T-complex protein 1 subunit gamma